MKIRARCAFLKGIPVQAHSSKGIALTFLFILAFGTWREREIDEGSSIMVHFCLIKKT